jgi:hypothetical protein
LSEDYSAREDYSAVTSRETCFWNVGRKIELEFGYEIKVSIYEKF